MCFAARAFSVVTWQQRRRLLVTAAAREVSTEGASKRRVSREQRKAMVKAYVAKYRMEHGGKFPTASVTQKQVGGGYYFVRYILQELEHNSKWHPVGTMDKITGQSDEVNVISPLSSKEIDGFSEVGEDRKGKVLVATTSVSNQYWISDVNGSSSEVEVSNNCDQRTIDMSIVMQNSGMPAEDDSSIVGFTAKHKGISEAGEVLDTEVLVDTIVVSKAYRTSADDDTSSEAKSHSNEGGWVVDTGANCNEISAETEDSTVGQTAKVHGISGVGEVLDSEVISGTTSVSNKYGISPDDSSSSQGEVGENSGQMMVDTPVLSNERFATDEMSAICRTDKTNVTSEVGGAVDSDMLVGKIIDSNDYGIPADNGSSSQIEASKNSGRTMAYASISTNHNEVSATDETSIAGQTVKVKGISEDDSEVSSKPGHPSEVPGARSTEVGNLDEASSQGSGSDQLTREKTQNEPQEASLWHNLKSFASSIISSWWK
ncbi:hypothetical protein Cgig2_016759 [Carnegiea gigantea]|uniref:AT3G52170-like helix-turn-helix domain-containing protein n=1 Tax=Carnegiea gigantea TaxID=171969 RepID=A0A9Q1L0C7_9CARY|nr:hypothetical protein Cgig2_016759 [Carnegiea gigantea]